MKPVTADMKRLTIEDIEKVKKILDRPEAIKNQRPVFADVKMKIRKGAFITIVTNEPA